VPLSAAQNEPGNFHIADKNYEHSPLILAEVKQVDNAPGVFVIKDQDQPESLE
jgi:hypothetical protein